MFRVMGWIDLWELELSGPCKDQPPEEWATNENQTVRNIVFSLSFFSEDRDD